MRIKCTHCQGEYQIEDAKLPARALNMRCPQCQHAVSLTGASREAGWRAVRSSQVFHKSNAVQKFAEMLSSLSPNLVAAELLEEQSFRKVILCLTHPQLRQQVAESLKCLQYEVHALDKADVALAELDSHRADILVLDHHFDKEVNGYDALRQCVETMPAKFRRRLFIVLVSPLYQTLDPEMAFMECVNLVLNPDDAKNTKAILDRALRDFNGLYASFNQAAGLEPL